MDRRTFLRNSAWCAGGLMATSALPSFADGKMPSAGATKPDMDVFLGRGGFERLTMNCITIEAGATKPFSVLHISDTHLTAVYDYEPVFKKEVSVRRTRTFGGLQERALCDSLAWARTNCDYVLHTGDLIDWQSEANFDLVRKYFGPEVFGSMGNHEFYTYMPDEKITSEESFKNRSWPLLAKAYPVDARFSSKVVNGINFICLDDAFGTVQTDQVEKFKAEVKRGLPIILAMHVPFSTPELWRATMRYWRERKRFTDAAVPAAGGDYLRQQQDSVTRDFIAYLRREPLLKGILAGHQHLFAQERFSPTAIQYIVAGNFLFAAQEVLFV